MVAHDILVSAKGPSVLGLGLKGLGPRLENLSDKLKKYFLPVCWDVVSSKVSKPKRSTTESKCLFLGSQILIIAGRPVTLALCPLI